MTEQISRPEPGRPPIGATAMTGAQREARRKQRVAERLQIAKAAADAAATAVEREADALAEAVGRPLAAEAVDRLQQAVRAWQAAYAVAVGARAAI